MGCSKDVSEGAHIHTTSARVQILAPAPADAGPGRWQQRHQSLGAWYSPGRALSLGSPGHYGHLGNKPAVGPLLPLSLDVRVCLSVSQINKYVKRSALGGRVVREDCMRAEMVIFMRLTFE